MESRFQSFPKYYRTEASPKILDSAFPPFKVEHRYRGVYERAGFDVNLNGSGLSSRSDSRSIYSTKSTSSKATSSKGIAGKGPTPPKTSPRSPLSAKSSPLSTKHDASKINHKNPYGTTSSVNNTKRSFGDTNKTNTYPRSHSIPVNSVRSFSDSQPSTGNSTRLFSDSIPRSRSISESRSTSPLSHQDNQIIVNQKSLSQLPPPCGDIFNFSPSSSQNKNFKNLSLNLNGKDVEAIDEITESAIDPDSSRDDSFNDTKDTSVSADKSYSNIKVPPENDGSSIITTNVSMDQDEISAHTRPPPLDQQTTAQQGQRGISFGQKFQPNSQELQYKSRVRPQERVPPQITHQHSPVDMPSTHKQNRLSSALNDFRKDIQDHKNYTPKIRTNPTTPVVAVPQLPNLSPSQLGLAKSQFSKPLNRGAFGPIVQESKEVEDGTTPHVKELSDREYEQHYQNSLNLDYQNFLNGETSSKQRHSQISMVSSVISKDSMYEDDMDDEIERELERQLETLKIGGSSSTKNMDISTINSSINENNDSVTKTSSIIKNEMAIGVPVFNIEDADAQLSNTFVSNLTANVCSNPVTESNLSSMEPSHHDSKCEIKDLSNSEYDSFEEDLDNVSSTASYESIQPLSVRHSRVKQLDKDIILPNSKVVSFNDNVLTNSPPSPSHNVRFNDVVIDDSSEPRVTNSNDYSPKLYMHPSNNQTPESYNGSELSNNDDIVKPLSPKNHEVEEELKDINFKINPVDQSPSQFMLPLEQINTKPITSEDIRETTSIDSKIKPEPETKYPPGHGPCRTCQKKVLSDGTGSQKSIYSKAGELSGQWHRSCFSCHFQNCNIKFNKKIQCYVLDDKPFCNQHYHELNSTLCQSCSNGIEGECIENELEQKWHLYCLTCFKCQDYITNDYYLINRAIYCESDAINIINGNESYKDIHGNLRNGGLSTQDKVEKRRTRVLFVE